MKLIVEELTQDQVQFLTEATKDGKGKDYYLTGVFMTAEDVNKNGRKYPKHILENEVGRYNNQYVMAHRAFGELCHTAVPTIDLTRVSHLIESLHFQGNNVIGKAKILDTPYGKIVKAFIDEGAQLGVSTRGVGSLVEQNGVKIVQEDFKLATAADIVHDPSAYNALVQGIMEQKEWLYEDGVWREADIESARKAIKNASKVNLVETQIQVFEKFMNVLKG